MQRLSSWPPKQWDEVNHGSYATEKPSLQRSLSYQPTTGNFVPQSYVSDRSAWRGTTQREAQAWDIDREHHHGQRASRHMSYYDPLGPHAWRPSKKKANIVELNDSHDSNQVGVVQFSGIGTSDAGSELVPVGAGEEVHELVVFGSVTI